MRFSAIGLLCFTLVLPLVLASLDYPFLKYFLALLLLDVCLYPAYRYLMHCESGVPTLPLLCLAYAVQFALPILTREQVMPVAFDVISLGDTEVEVALLMAIIGLVVLQATFYLMRTQGIAQNLPSVALRLNKRRAVIFCVGVFALSFILRAGESLIIENFGLQLNAVLNLIQNQMLVAIGILGWLVYTSRGARWHKALLYMIVAVAMVRGSATSMMESMLLPVMVLFATKWVYTRRLPLFGFIAVAGLMIFLSPVKGAFRSMVGQEVGATKQSTAVERSMLWLDQATEFWTESLTGERAFAEWTSDLTSRTDLIHQFAYIYSETPSVVPFQNGGTYKYFAVALIPRALWPGKPVANSANNFYAINYGITTEEGVQTSSFGASLIGEGYMNFGLLGVLLAMTMQGLILSLLEQVFGGVNAGAGGMAIFIAIFVSFLNGIGSSAELMFGGIIQNLLCSAVLLWWARDRLQHRAVSAASFVRQFSLNNLTRLKG